MEAIFSDKVTPKRFIHFVWPSVLMMVIIGLYYNMDSIFVVNLEMCIRDRNIVKRAAHILSEITNLTAFALTPKKDQDTLKYINLLPVDESTVVPVSYTHLFYTRDFPVISSGMSRFMSLSIVGAISQSLPPSLSLSLIHI